MKTSPKRNIYYIDGISAEDMANEHFNLITELSQSRKEIINFNEIPCTSFESFELKYADIPSIDKVRPLKSILINKYAFLIHKLISRTKLQEKGNFTHLSSKVLKATLGNVYLDMLETLKRLNLITIDHEYIPTQKSKTYILNSENLKIACKKMFVPHLEKYFTSMEKELKKYENFNQELFKDKVGKKLYENYTSSLQYLSLIDSDKAEVYIDNHKFYNDKSKDYYIRILEEFQNKNFKILSVDNNLRIYSILTQTPRILKNVLNLKYGCDISNSHPLLFNKIIMDKYGIKSNILFSIYSIIKDNTVHFSRYVGHQLKKELIINGLEELEIAKIPDDILEYIIKTSLGIFWDDFLEVFPTLTRADIKITLFKEVFYSKSITSHGKEFAKKFKEHYPNVYRLVNECKKEDRTRLANDLMKIESELFQNILIKLYNKRFKVLSIHDAIVVLDVKLNKKCTPELVKEIIEKEYKEIGLFPNVAVEYYTGDNIIEELKFEEFSQILINKELKLLYSALEDSSHPLYSEYKNIVSELENGQYELVVDRKTSKVKIHPTKS